MGFFRKYFEQRKRKKQAAIEKRYAFSLDIPTSTFALEAFFSDINVYIDPFHVAKWQDQWSGLIIRASSHQQRQKKKTPLEMETINKIIDYNEIVSKIDERVKSHNDSYIASTER